MPKFTKSECCLQAALALSLLGAALCEVPGNRDGAGSSLARAERDLEALIAAAMSGDAEERLEAAAAVETDLEALGRLAATPEARGRDDLAALMSRMRAALYWHTEMTAREAAGAGAAGLDAAVAAYLLDSAREFEELHPGDLAPARLRYRAVLDDHAGTPAALEAAAAIARLDAAIEARATTAEDSGAEAAPLLEGEAAIDGRPYWQRIADRLAALEPGDSRQVKIDVRRHVQRKELALAFDLARRARDAASDPATRATLTGFVSEVERALSVLTSAATSGRELVGGSHVFRLGSGTILTGEVHAFSGTAFTIETSEGATLSLALSALSLLGLAQVATAGPDGATAFPAAAALFMLAGEHADMDRYLELARRHGLADDDLEVACAVAREIGILERELPAARTTWQHIERAMLEFLDAMTRRDYDTALQRIDAIALDIRDEDLHAIDEMAHSRADVSLEALIDEARRTCRVDHQNDHENLVVCSVCEGDGIATSIRDPQLGRGLRREDLRCATCDGTGMVSCAACRSRFHDPQATALQERLMSLHEESR